MEITKAGLTDPKLIQKFKDDCNIRGLSEHTIESYISILRLFSSFLINKDSSLLSLNREILRDYLSLLRNDDIDRKTIKNRFSAISAFYEYAVYEKLIEKNIVVEIRKRYLKSYKLNDQNGHERKLVSIDEMSMFVTSIIDTRDKAIALLLAKTGIRRRELVTIDVDDINWAEMSITLKPTHKRSNRVVFFDYECAMILKRWLKKRETMVDAESPALFVSYDTGTRLNRNGVYNAFTKWAEKVGLHKSCSDKMEDHFTPHCCRHWYTTFLRRAGMPREFIQELRGDARNSAIDIYDHIDRDELKKSYLAHIPQLALD